ncbi:MAG: excinuclease ABC subunit UvrA [Bacteroidaceae bacterium]|nr:excinuclease ABC subunit UvrA [Bacteroidaceae bacterium]
MDDITNKKGSVVVTGARENNLKNINVEIPHNSLTVVTGLSGSGKSSLAFDTVYAEGQRRYIETFSQYARNFIGVMHRPEVDSITGLNPVVSIEQKTTSRNPRSTVGTSTQIYDYLRLLFARVGTAYSYVTGKPMVRYSRQQIIDSIFKEHTGHRVFVMAPMVRNRKGHYRELFEMVRRKGYLNVRVDGVMQEVKVGMKLDRYKNHTIEVVVEKLIVEERCLKRLSDGIDLALKMGDGVVSLLSFENTSALGPIDYSKGVLSHYSKNLMCVDSGISYKNPAPHNFSFNSPMGCCPKCKGLGQVSMVDIDKVIPNRNLSIAKGAIAPLGEYRNTIIFRQIEGLLLKYGYSIDTPVNQLPDEFLDELMNGSSERIKVQLTGLKSQEDSAFVDFDGLSEYVRALQQQPEITAAEQKWINQFAVFATCPECGGARLNRESLHFRIDGYNIHQLASMDIKTLYSWCNTVEERLDEQQRIIAAEILKEIRTRLKFMLDVGLDYLSISRSSDSLSGGESQRIRLTTQIGSKLVNVLYILDEPSIGLHQRDNVKLINSLKQLRDSGNTVLVVEHDRDMMLAADWIIDLGPFAGRRGGNVVYQGTPEGMLQTETLTTQYIAGTKQIEIPVERRKGSGQFLTLHGCRGNNLKNVDVAFPLGLFVCVTGVSGSGKSTLVNDTLQPLLSQKFYNSLQVALPYDSVEGIELVDKVVCVDQTPIGRSPRSNPATYTGLFTDIRNLFASLPESQIRGYKSGRFSFNMAAGRCPECNGNGYKNIELRFMPDVMVPCHVCQGARYNSETLEVKYKGKSIADVLDMTINQAAEFFTAIPAIMHKLTTLQNVGLGYLKLGQSSTTISGGESQRVKLATELSKKDTGKTIYILDEPTTGLHFEDINVLLKVLQQLVDRGNTVIVIEHNMDVIKVADWIIDMGPEGGNAGGTVVVAGTPEQVADSGIGFTAPFLKEELNRFKNL